MKTNSPVPHERFCELAIKYAVPVPDSWRLGVRPESDENKIESWYVKCGPDRFVPIFPWRSERRFIELRNIVATKTLEDVVLCRFSCVSDGQSANLRQILYKEFDLLEWITGSKIVSVFGSSNGEIFSNVLTRHENGTVASIEAGTTLPQGAETLDRHELVARRGVASDRTVDTHIPQQSIYLFGKGGVQSWTDNDAELFDMAQDEINAIRAALELARRPEIAEPNIAQHKRLFEMVECVF